MYSMLLANKTIEKKKKSEEIHEREEVEEKSRVCFAMLQFCYFELFAKLIFFANSTFVEFCLALAVCKKGTARSICATL